MSLATGAHITIVDVHGSRRIMGPEPRRHNLCGGALTDRDWLVADARRSTNAELLDLGVCAQCVPLMRQLVERADAARRAAREAKLRAQIDALKDESGNLKPLPEWRSPSWARRSAR